MAYKPPEWKKRFWRQLYKLYSMNNSAGSLYRGRVTFFGFLVVVMLCLSISLRIGTLGNALTGVIALSFTILILGVGGMLFRSAKVRVTRNLPAMATIGVPFNYDINIENLHKKSTGVMRVRELSYNPAPSKEVFVQSIEPGEEKRNAFDRLFVVYRWKWLADQRLGYRAYESDVIEIKAGKSQQIKAQLLPVNRGEHSLENLHLYLPDPLFLFQKSSKPIQSKDSILILPKNYRVKPLHLLGLGQADRVGDISSLKKGDSNEFLGLREYRSGDPIKSIDWKTWARCSIPFVKEFEDEFEPNFTLFLDTCVAPINQAEFEVSVSLVTSYLISESGQQVRSLLLRTSEGIKYYEQKKEGLNNLLTTVSCADFQSNYLEEEELETIAAEGSKTSATVLFLSSWDTRLESLIEKLLNRKIPLIVFIVSQEVESLRSEIESSLLDIKPIFLGVNNTQEELRVI